MEIITFITENYEAIFGIIFSAVGIAATVARFTKTPKDDKIVSKVQGIVKKIADVIGMNHGEAKNKD